MFSLNTYWQTLKLFQNISFFVFPFPVLSRPPRGDSAVAADLSGRRSQQPTTDGQTLSVTADLGQIPKREHFRKLVTCQGNPNKKEPGIPTRVTTCNKIRAKINN